MCKCMNVFVYMYVYIYIYMHVHLCVYVYMYMYMFIYIYIWKLTSFAFPSPTYYVILKNMSRLVFFNTKLTFSHGRHYVFSNIDPKTLVVLSIFNDLKDLHMQCVLLFHQ